MYLTRALALTVLAFLPLLGRSADQAVKDFVPDPYTVQRYGPAYRYSQDGWIVLHIEGEPYERGYQHGQLLASEIAAHVRCFAAEQSPKAPSEGWRQTRLLVNALFLRKVDKEYLEEMKGIADGATAAGARFDNRPLDVIDIVALNAWPEVETLDSGLDALPTGLEGMRFPKQQPRAMPAPKPMHCSAFAATGPATRDGKIVFGHITMFGLRPSYFYNVWIDVKPARGQRVIMQSYPAGIQSGLDYYMNDAGIIVCETTIAQTRFNIDGASLQSRIRQALQYADSIDKVVEILGKSNNGLYSNEWLLADIKTNEVAMFELGTAKSRLYRSSKNDWFAGTEGFYWGCNNTKDLDVRLETIAALNDRPAHTVFAPSERDKMWVKLYKQYKGKIDADFGKLAFTTPPLAAFSSVDAKFTTTDMAKELKSWALFGPPLGRTWQPTFEQKQQHDDIKPLVSNPWTILHANPPAPAAAGQLVAVDLGDKASSSSAKSEPRLENVPAWHGSLLPKTDADIGLVAAFVDYERYVALENSLRDDENKTEPLSTEERARLGLEVAGARSSYRTAILPGQPTPLTAIKSDATENAWFKVASSRAVLMLHELRAFVGHEPFVTAMDKFGRQNAGKAVSMQDFFSYLERESRKPIADLRRYWTQETSLPGFKLESAALKNGAGPQRVEGMLIRSMTPVQYPQTIAITVETAKGEVTKNVAVNEERTPFTIEVDAAPQRVIVDKYGLTPKANGGNFSVGSYQQDLANCLIVYGTRHEVASNREAADLLQQAIISRGSNFTVQIKKDRDVTDEDIRGNHLLLIGRPDSNTLVERFKEAFPVELGLRSVKVGADIYAHHLSGVIAAAQNPLGQKYSLVVLAGLSAEATRDVAPKLTRAARRGADVLIFPRGGEVKALTMPAKELVRDLKATADRRTARQGTGN